MTLSIKFKDSPEAFEASRDYLKQVKECEEFYNKTLSYREKYGRYHLESDFIGFYFDGGFLSISVGKKEFGIIIDMDYIDDFYTCNDKQYYEEV